VRDNSQRHMITCVNIPSSAGSICLHRLYIIMQYDKCLIVGYTSEIAIDLIRIFSFREASNSANEVL
jgi:hypothetical protein